MSKEFFLGRQVAALAAIPAQTIGCDYPMARNNNWYGVIAVGRTDRPGSQRVSQFRGNLSVRFCNTKGNLKDVLERLAIKSADFQVQFDGKFLQLSGKICFQLPFNLSIDFPAGCELRYLEIQPDKVLQPDIGRAWEVKKAEPLIRRQNCYAPDR